MMELAIKIICVIAIVAIAIWRLEKKRRGGKGIFDD